MDGVSGKILSINLSEKTVQILSPPESLYKKYIGGKGLAGYYLKPYVRHSWDSPHMPLLFMTGPLVNTASPTSGRMTIMSRSPLTGTVGDTSVGGKLGIQLKRAGWDGVIITGKSESLCGISIDHSKVEFVDAQHLAGLHISQAARLLPPDGAHALTGPAADNGVYFANIAVGTHSFSGRNGLGLSMAAKKLKYLWVKGNNKTTVYSREILKKAREEIYRLAAASSVIKGGMGLSELGTGALFDLINHRRMIPVKNFKKTYFSDGNKVNAWQYKQKYKTKSTGCAGCHILCKKKGSDKSIMPEYETMSHFSALLENNDTDVVVEANRICNELGMDTISAAATLGCYAEIHKIHLKPVDILRLLKNIGLSKGVGNELKLGSFLYAQMQGASHVSMSVKGLEMPAYDPRGAYGMALAYATSTRGACHLRAYPISHEILRKPVATDRFSFSGKARIIKLNEDMNAVIDSLTACKFIFFGASLEEYAQALYGVTGIETSAQELLTIGERIYFNERIMNYMNGFTIKDDCLPERFFLESGTSGDGLIVDPINKEDFTETLFHYYQIRGIALSGKPEPSKAEELDLI